MTRIIAGLAAQTSLSIPSSGTRPTSDRVREALFAALDARGAIDEARVLDLFAGSGALGLEAASRGAASVVLVDSAKPAAAVAQRNANAVAERGAARASVVTQRAERFLADSDAEFDLVLIDPPYDLDAGVLHETLTLLVTLLADDAIVVLEQSKRAGAPDVPGLELERSKKYGDTVIHWLSPTLG
ncbi:16S rRNA (guanine(966)-N(2))-methyltransferase RsmD [uncultured Agrococcus sp.]|uniref:16S rRNA (guanine(966)-N(2))-methyltransferase RsmD n=1 Tax=uncultured Agrococcus sp. TaxID=382258 RepID=UPI0025CEA4C1|nr:16S rRNA (guanine(966)-N(2))-methyltransferase RsmD [uncultured Agrococcus sp.]